MNEATLILYLTNFTVIGLLPIIFFKKGTFNLMWCLTSAPYVLSATALAVSYAGWLPPLTGYGTFWSDVAAVIAVPFSVSSIALIFITMGTHRVPLALWHQQQDGPHHIVTYGPYRRIRHPFYASFLLALFGAFLFAPQAGTLSLFLYGVISLNVTAQREERRLKSSAYGAEYEQYMQQAGRFLPKLRTRAVN
jgi:protein-S-isoprenylcysteine O-methyltransferase Ste14